MATFVQSSSMYFFEDKMLFVLPSGHGESTSIETSVLLRFVLLKYPVGALCLVKLEVQKAFTSMNDVEAFLGHTANWFLVDAGYQLNQSDILRNSSYLKKLRHTFDKTT